MTRLHGIESGAIKKLAFLAALNVYYNRITAAVREALDARFALQELPAAAVTGISEPVVTYAVEGVLPG